MDGEPELPTLPKPSTTYPIRNPWKRVRQSSPAASSSDAVFSSDDNPSADNYCQSRRKKLYRGPWYAHHRMGETAEPKQPVQAGKRTLRRQYDSGVWMGSDISSSDEAVLHPQAPALSPGTASKHRHLITEHQQPSVSPEVAAIKVVTNCVENCDENVDLSGLDLYCLRKDIIELLATFTRVPSDLATKEGYYTTLEANLRLNLASNNFSVLPKELCTIQSLTQISLRNNAFSELPLALSTCPNLGTINIAQNHFRYLPFAFLKAYNCRHMIYDITFHPNPFVIPEHVKAHISAIENPQTTSLAPLHKPPLGLDIHGITGSKDGSGWLVYSFRTETRFLDAYGTRITGPIFPFDDPDGPSVTSIPAVGIDDIPTPPSVVSRAPSLSEIAIRACVKHPQLHDLPEFLPQDSPDKVKRILDLAITVNYSGSRTCSVCEKSFVVPRTEWIEWWHVKDVLLPYLGQGVWGVRDLEERHIPFMRHGCSWKCVP